MPRAALVYNLLLLCVRWSRCGALLGANIVCARGLTERQRALCHAAPAAVAALGNGLSMAYAECRAQLAGRRWNCSGVGDDPRLGHVLPLATREAAFTYAITAAGVTHALSEACARGDLPACACAANRRRFSGAAEQFEYGGCGEASFGARFARRFLDARELEADARAAMNLHNNRVGRKVVKEMVRRECKCHGVSGSCAVRTCWRALPPFPAVGAALRDKLRRAKHVVAEEYDLRGLHARAVALRHPRLVVRRTGKPPRKSELVFLAKSPQYCEPDAAAAAPGTHGRHCNRTSKGEDGCDLLCCGRGYSTVTLVREAKCRCQFHWCCSVSCHSCVTRTDTHVCN
ncbi:protein Wnt-7b [Ostrinia nubilalis]|uniref:protein Wnt-7b n=1 Tax=Ostrinia nubilalis TaxID=29057 RepID=UPI0030825780